MCRHVFTFLNKQHFFSCILSTYRRLQTINTPQLATMIRRMTTPSSVLIGKYNVHYCDNFSCALSLKNLAHLVPHFMPFCSFEYAKTVKSFDFNYNGNPANPGATEAELQPVTGSDNIICKNCWVYLGATAFIVVDWSTSFGLDTAMIGDWGYGHDRIKS